MISGAAFFYWVIFPKVKIKDIKGLTNHSFDT